MRTGVLSSACAGEGGNPNSALPLLVELLAWIDQDKDSRKDQENLAVSKFAAKVLHRRLKKARGAGRHLDRMTGREEGSVASQSI